MLTELHVQLFIVDRPYTAFAPGYPTKASLDIATYITISSSITFISPLTFIFWLCFNNIYLYNLPVSFVYNFRRFISINVFNRRSFQALGAFPSANGLNCCKYFDLVLIFCRDNETAFHTATATERHPMNTQTNKAVV